MWRRLRFPHRLGGILLIGFVGRVVYLVGQRSDGWAAAQPILDGWYYYEWAHALAQGTAGPLAGHPGHPGSAFYLAPLYPIVFSLFLRVAGLDLGLILLYYAQTLLTVCSAGVLALAVRRWVGDHAALAAAALLLSYHPLLFFSVRPIGETVAITLLALALWAASGKSVSSLGVAGVLVGMAALARPNLLLVPILWAIAALVGRKWTHAAALALGLAAVVLPVTARNVLVSGHPVPISSNGGLTLYHGNGPDARGHGRHVPGLSGDLRFQRQESTRLASFLEGRELDAVEADRWWAGRAIEVRLADVPGSMGLFLRRAMLTLSNEEMSLDYAPGLDRGLWRYVAPVPLAGILGLAAVALYFGGWRRSGGLTVWLGVLACAATPLVFYVTSRYRLPLVFLLCIPAGAGLSELLAAENGGRRRWIGVAILVAVGAASVFMPTGGLADTSRAQALANRARIARRYQPPTQELVAGAESDLRRALELDPLSRLALDEMYDLLRTSGRVAEFAPYNRYALENDPMSKAERWAALVLEAVAQGDLTRARGVAEQAAADGERLDPSLIEKLRQATVGKEQAAETIGATR